MSKEKERSNLGRLILENRTRIGISGPALAKEVGISGPFLTQLETQGKSLAPEKAERLAHALGIDPALVLDAIFLDKHPTVAIRPLQAVQRFGWYVEFTELEQRRVEKFARSKGWKNPEAMIRRLVLDLVDDKT